MSTLTDFSPPSVQTPPPAAPPEPPHDEISEERRRRPIWPITIVLTAVLAIGVSLAVIVSGRSGDTGSDESTQEDHKAELAIGENEFVTRFVVPVDGYSYVNDHGGAYEDFETILETVESANGNDTFGAVSLHSVLADDPSQNTAEVWNGDWEVGYLNLIQLNEAIPFGTDEEWSEFAIRLSLGDAPYEAIDQLDLSGTAVFVFENSVLPNSRFHYVWLDQGVGGILDGADRAPLERWLTAYLAVPKLAEGETTELAARLISIPGFRYSNVDPDTIIDSERPVALNIPHTLHFVTDSSGNLGMLVVAPTGHATELENWMMQIADFQVTARNDIHGHLVEVFEGRSGERSVRSYAWDDGDFAAVLTTNPDLEDQVLTFIDAFLDT